MVIGCTQAPENQTTELLLQKLDSMDKKIDSLQAKLQPVKDTSTKTPVKLNPKDSTSEIKKNPLRTKKKDSVITVSPSKSTKEIFYYTNTKKISLLIEPWVDGRRKLIFYNHNGETTYTQDDVHMSYSTTTSVKSFHANGAVKGIEVHFNPGASLYMYQSNITFDEDNTPLWKTDSQWPSRLEDHMKPPSYWDKKEKVWKQQETIIEQPYTNQ